VSTIISDLSGDWLLVTSVVGGIPVPPPVPPPAPVYTSPVSEPPSPAPSTEPVVNYNYPAAAITAFLAGLFFLIVFVPARTGIGKRSVSDNERSEEISISIIKDLLAKADVLWSSK
jgi:hypothetical protein